MSCPLCAIREWWQRTFPPAPRCSVCNGTFDGPFDDWEHLACFDLLDTQRTQQKRIDFWRNL